MRASSQDAKFLGSNSPLRARDSLSSSTCAAENPPTESIAMVKWPQTVSAPLSLVLVVGAPSVDPENLHDFVAQMIDHLDCYAAGSWLRKRPRGVAIESCPGFLVDLGPERGLERLVWIVGAEEVRVAHEEALFVVVGVDEPARDAVGAVA